MHITVLASIVACTWTLAPKTQFFQKKKNNIQIPWAYINSLLHTTSSFLFSLLHYNELHTLKQKILTSINCTLTTFWRIEYPKMKQSMNYHTIKPLVQQPIRSNILTKKIQIRKMASNKKKGLAYSCVYYFFFLCKFKQSMYTDICKQSMIYKLYYFFFLCRDHLHF